MDQARESSAGAPAADFVLPPAFRIALNTSAGALVGGVPAESLERSATTPVWPTWQTALREQMAGSDLLVHESSMTLSEACDRARPRAPLVTWISGQGWLALLDGQAGRVLVARPHVKSEWMSEEALSSWVGQPQQEEPATWFVLEPRLFPGKRNGDESLTPFRRLLDIAHPDRIDILAIFLYAAFSGLLSLAIPIAVQQLVNTVAFGGLIQPVVVLAILLLLGLTIAASLSAFQSYLAEILQQRIFVRACLDLADRLARVTPEAFGTSPPAAFVNRFFDLVTVQKTGARLLLEGSGVLLQTSTGLLVLSFYHPLMLALSVLLFASMGIVAFLFGRGAPRTAIRESSAKYKIAEWMEELVRHTTTFRTSAGRSYAEGHADSLIAQWVSARRRHYRLVFRQFVAALGLQVIVNTGLLALGGILVVAGELTLGQLVASEIIVASVVASFARLAKHFESYYDLLAAVEKVGGLFDLPVEEAGLSDETFQEGPATIHIRNLTLSNDDRSVLQDSSLEFLAGERVSITGATGVDRSAVMDVLAGMHPPDSGYVTIDGHDLRELNPQQIRDNISLIRSPKIVPETILNNLTIGSVQKTSAQVKEVLELVDLLDDIRGLPEGLDTRLTESGAPLSRSQLLRLEFARVLLARPSVVLLDSDTTGLDEPCMAPALDALFAATEPWTLLSVASNSSLGSRCDRTLRLDQGKLTEADESSSNSVSPGERS